MKNSILIKVLQASKENKQLIGIRKYGDEDDFWCGYIHDSNEDLVYIQHFTKFGKSDGLIIEKIDNIECFEFDDEYSKSYQYLINNHDKLESLKSIEIIIVDSENWQFEILKQLSEHDRLIKIEINNDSAYTGSIAEFDNEMISLACVGNLGEDEGKALYRLSDITSIQFDRMEERKRQLLYQWRKNRK